MSKELKNVYEFKNAITYLKNNPNIKEDSYSLEALYHIEQALTELEELRAFKEKVKRYFVIENSINFNGSIDYSFANKEQKYNEEINETIDRLWKEWRNLKQELGVDDE